MKSSLVIIALIITYIFTSAPSGIAVTKHGTPSGIINELKEMVQGRSFWQQQEKLIIKKIGILERQPAEDAKFEKEMALYESETRQDDKKFYKEYPDMRPSAAEQKAQHLRDQADAIEDQQFKSEMEQYRLSELNELNVLLRVVKHKTSNKLGN